MEKEINWIDDLPEVEDVWKRDLTYSHDSAGFDSSKTEKIDYGEEGTLLLNRYDAGSGTVDSIRVNKDIFVLGRSEGDVDHVINGRGVSRKHCYITRRDGGWYVCDMNSTNGVILNGSQVIHGQEIEIADGDMIQIGEREYIVESV